MPFYYTLKRLTDEDRKRISSNLLKLRKRLKESIPPRTVKETLIISTWNIRNFGSSRFSFGARLPESLFYIAEIISKFDIVAVQEVDHDLKTLDDLLEILGPSWSYFASSTSFRRSANNQRLVFLFDARKIKFKNIAGQIILDERDLIQGKYQFARSPYFASFQAENFEFSLCAVHMWYGGRDERHISRRVEEIKTLGRILNKKTKRDNTNIIALGDFNIVSPDHITMQTLLESGFTVPDELVVPSNVRGDKFYDQIAFKVKEKELQLGDSDESSGVFDFFETVFRESDFNTYKKKTLKDYFDKREGYESVAKQRRFYKYQWRTRQMSDHNPLWIELKIDFSKDRLEEMRNK